MLTIKIPDTEVYDEINNLFIQVKGTTLVLEHSLVSISKWESKWKKEFISNKPKTHEESIDYIKCMTITQNVNDDVYKYLPDWVYKKVDEYIGDPMTATTFSTSSNGKKNTEKITSEVIYYWMITLGIPMECQKWHLNRLLTLIRVCEIKNAPQKKMSKSEVMRRNASLNASRRAALNSKG